MEGIEYEQLDAGFFGTVASMYRRRPSLFNQALAFAILLGAVDFL